MPAAFNSKKVPESTASVTAAAKPTPAAATASSKASTTTTTTTTLPVSSWGSATTRRNIVVGAGGTASEEAVPPTHQASNGAHPPAAAAHGAVVHESAAAPPAPDQPPTSRPIKQPPPPTRGGSGSKRGWETTTTVSVVRASALVEAAAAPPATLAASSTSTTIAAAVRSATPAEAQRPLELVTFDPAVAIVDHSSPAKAAGDHQTPPSAFSGGPAAASIIPFPTTPPMSGSASSNPMGGGSLLRYAAPEYRPRGSVSPLQAPPSAAAVVVTTPSQPRNKSSSESAAGSPWRSADTPKLGSQPTPPRAPHRSTPPIYHAVATTDVGPSGTTTAHDDDTFSVVAVISSSSRASAAATNAFQLPPPASLGASPIASAGIIGRTTAPPPSGGLAIPRSGSGQNLANNSSTTPATAAAAAAALSNRSPPSYQRTANMLATTLGPASSPNAVTPVSSTGADRTAVAGTLTTGMSVATSAPSSVHAPSHWPWDYILVVDFEATCVEPTPADFIPEIIEFPVVLIDVTKQQVVGEFHRFVKPVRNPKLSAFCTELTGIDQETVDNAREITEVVAQFDAWLAATLLAVPHHHHFPSIATSGGAAASLSSSATASPPPPSGSASTNLALSSAASPPTPTTTSGCGPTTAASSGQPHLMIATDGPWDMVDFMYRFTVLAAGHQAIFSPLFYHFIDVKKAFADYFGSRRGKIQAMLDHLGMTFEGRPHSGMADARNIARIVLALIRRGCPLAASVIDVKQAFAALPSALGGNASGHHHANAAAAGSTSYFRGSVSSSSSLQVAAAASTSSTTASGSVSRPGSQSPAPMKTTTSVPPNNETPQPPEAISTEGIFLAASSAATLSRASGYPSAATPPTPSRNATPPTFAPPGGPSSSGFEFPSTMTMMSAPDVIAENSNAVDLAAQSSRRASSTVSASTCHSADAFGAPTRANKQPPLLPQPRTHDHQPPQETIAAFGAHGALLARAGGDVDDTLIGSDLPRDPSSASTHHDGTMATTTTTTSSTSNSGSGRTSRRQEDVAGTRLHRPARGGGGTLTPPPGGQPFTTLQSTSNMGIQSQTNSAPSLRPIRDTGGRVASWAAAAARGGGLSSGGPSSSLKWSTAQGDVAGFAIVRAPPPPLQPHQGARSGGAMPHYSHGYSPNWVSAAALQHPVQSPPTAGESSCHKSSAGNREESSPRCAHTDDRCDDAFSDDHLRLDSPRDHPRGDAATGFPSLLPAAPATMTAAARDSPSSSTRVAAAAHGTTLSATVNLMTLSQAVNNRQPMVDSATEAAAALSQHSATPTSGTTSGGHGTSSSATPPSSSARARQMVHNAQRAAAQARMDDEDDDDDDGLLRVDHGSSSSGNGTQQESSTAVFEMQLASTSAQAITVKCTGSATAAFSNPTNSCTTAMMGAPAAAMAPPSMYAGGRLYQPTPTAPQHVHHATANWGSGHLMASSLAAVSSAASVGSSSSSNNYYYPTRQRAIPTGGLRGGVTGAAAAAVASGHPASQMSASGMVAAFAAKGTSTSPPPPHPTTDGEHSMRHPQHSGEEGVGQPGGSDSVPLSVPAWSGPSGQDGARRTMAQGRGGAHSTFWRGNATSYRDPATAGANAARRDAAGWGGSNSRNPPPPATSIFAGAPLVAAAGRMIHHHHHDAAAYYAAAAQPYSASNNGSGYSVASPSSSSSGANHHWSSGGGAASGGHGMDGWGPSHPHRGNGGGGGGAGRSWPQGGGDPQVPPPAT